MKDITIPIENVTPRGDWGYISYRPSDGAILVGKSGDSEWIEIPKEIADLFGFNRVERVSDSKEDRQVSGGWSVSQKEAIEKVLRAFCYRVPIQYLTGTYQDVLAELERITKGSDTK